MRCVGIDWSKYLSMLILYGCADDSIIHNSNLRDLDIPLLNFFVVTRRLSDIETRHFLRKQSFTLQLECTVHVWSINYDRTTNVLFREEKGTVGKKWGNRNKYPEMIWESWRFDSIRRKQKSEIEQRDARTIDVRLIEAGTKKKFVLRSKEKIEGFISQGNFKPFLRITYRACVFAERTLHRDHFCLLCDKKRDRHETVSSYEHDKMCGDRFWYF